MQGIFFLIAYMLPLSFTTSISWEERKSNPKVIVVVFNMKCEMLGKIMMMEKSKNKTSQFSGSLWWDDDDDARKNCTQTQC